MLRPRLLILERRLPGCPLSRLGPLNATKPDFANGLRPCLGGRIIKFGIRLRSQSGGCSLKRDPWFLRRFLGHQVHMLCAKGQAMIRQLLAVGITTLHNGRPRGLVAVTAIGRQRLHASALAENGRIDGCRRSWRGERYGRAGIVSLLRHLGLTGIAYPVAGN